MSNSSGEVEDFFSEEGKSMLDRSTPEMTIKVGEDCVKLIITKVLSDWLKGPT